MKKIYIIPGMGESCKLVRYKKFSNDLKKSGYFVVPINPDWKKPLTTQCFKVNKDSVIFGFSMGAVLAYLSAQKHPCKKVILASISPINTVSYKVFQNFLSEHMTLKQSIDVTKDILSIRVILDNSKTPYITMMGEKEKLTKGEKIADFIVPKATHRIDKVYRDAILKLL